MFVRNKSEAPTRQREGLTCHLLLQEHDVRGDQLAVTWVDVEPGSRQQPHMHIPHQVYVIVRGSGRMLVGEEEREVGEGDVVFIPSRMLHGIENLSYDDTLTYVTAATPAFDIKAMYDEGQQVEALVTETF